MTPNPSTMPNPAQPLPTGGLGGAVGKPAPGMGGGAPVTPPPKTAADHAVEQVMRKLGKSMSRRPLSRDGTKFEAIKKKLRKQKSKK